LVLGPWSLRPWSLGPWPSLVGGLLLLNDVELDAFALDVEAKPHEQAHVDVGHPDERQPPKQQPRPSLDEHSKSGERNRQCRDVMTEAVLAGEHIEELARNETPPMTALPHTPRVEFGKELLMRDRPGGARDRVASTNSHTI
jgi:hypothetical protein